VKRFCFYLLYLLIAWGSIRYFIALPEVVEELWFKPLVWLTPLVIWNVNQQKPIFLFGGSWWRSVLLGVLVGIFYFVLLSGWKSVALLNMDLMGVMLATAIVEETVFSGFLTKYLSKYLSLQWVLIVVGFSVGLSRLPILIFVYELPAVELFAVLIFVISTGIVHAWIRMRSNNVLGSIVARFVLGLVK